MATKKHNVTGTAMWAKVFDSNKELKDWQGNPHEFGGLFKIDVVLDKENKAVYKSSGTSGKGKFDDDGNFIATFKRKEKERFDWAGGPPIVVNEDGTLFEGTLIPNGSKVSVDFSVFPTSKSPGTRLEKITVLELAEMPERKEEPEVKTEAAKPMITANSTVTIPF